MELVVAEDNLNSLVGLSWLPRALSWTPAALQLTGHCAPGGSTIRQRGWLSVGAECKLSGPWSPNQGGLYLCHFMATWCHSNSELSCPIYMSCKCVFTLLPGEVFSVMLMVNYLTRAPLLGEGTEGIMCLRLGSDPLSPKGPSRPTQPPALPSLHFSLIFSLCSLCQIPENSKEPSGFLGDFIVLGNV